MQRLIARAQLAGDHGELLPQYLARFAGFGIGAQGFQLQLQGA